MADNTNIDDFNGLKTAIQAKQAPLNITNSPIGWPENSPLTINYNATFTTPQSEATFDGNRKSRLFVVSKPTIWGEGGDNIFTFQNAAVQGPRVYGGALVVSAHVTFNNPALFQNNRLTNPSQFGADGGVGIRLSQATLVFNKAVTFINNVLDSGAGGSIGGAILVESGSAAFNYSAVFTGNSARNGGAIGSGTNGKIDFFNSTIFSQNSGAYGGGIRTGGKITFNGSVTFRENSGSIGGALNPVGGSTTIFNDMAAFMENTAISSPGIEEAIGGAIALHSGGEVAFFGHHSLFIGNKAPNGGAIHTAGMLTFNHTATFLNNTARKGKGGAIHLHSDTADVILRTVNPSDPSIFSGNKPNAIYFDGAGRLTLDTGVDTLISIQDGISSANSAPTITKQGSGTWRQAGNSTDYGGTTNITAGSLYFEAGTGGYENTVYGNTNSGTFTLGPGGTLVFSDTPGSTTALLQAAMVNLNGGTVTVSLVEPGEGTVILSGSPINGGAFAAGDILNQGQTQFCDWQFVFASPSEVVLKVKKRS